MSSITGLSQEIFKTGEIWKNLVLQIFKKPEKELTPRFKQNIKGFKLGWYFDINISSRGRHIHLLASHYQLQISKILWPRIFDEWQYLANSVLLKFFVKPFANITVWIYYCVCCKTWSHKRQGAMLYYTSLHSHVYMCIKKRAYSL